MKVAISNIAWRADEERAVAERLVARGIRGVEVAPGMVSPRPASASDDEIRRYRDSWNARGIEIVALQALLFGTDGLAIFGPESSRRALLDYLARIVRLGGMLGARALVFGSPGNRRVGALDADAIEAIALPFFRDLGALAVHHGTCVCLEPVPRALGADWIVDARSALAFVERVSHPGIGIHLDAAALFLADEGAPEIRRAGADLRHFHASQPGLVPLATGGPVPHERYAGVLREIGYERWVSVEMRAGPAGESNLARVEAALGFALATYGSR